MEFDCVICGSPVELGRWALGCTVFCEGCYNDKEVMDWYREKQAKKVEAMNHAKTA